MEESTFGQMATADGINLMLYNFFNCLGSMIYIEFIDAPLQKVNTEVAPWTLKDQLKHLKIGTILLGSRMLQTRVWQKLYSLITADPKPCHAPASYSKAQKDAQPLF